MTQAGAQHPNGSIGMIVDPSPKRLVRGEFDAICNPGDNHGMPSVEGKGGHKFLEKVHRGILKSKADYAQQSPNRSKILCMVYAHENSHSLRAIAETWGQQCDGFFAASNTTDHSIGSINLLHKGPEEYVNMWPKVLSMWLYAHQHYRSKFDYFHISGDDVYVAVDNLRAFLDGPNVAAL